MKKYSYHSAKELKKFLSILIVGFFYLLLVKNVVEAECLNAHFEFENSLLNNSSKIEDFLNPDIHPELQVIPMELEKEYLIDPELGEYDAKWFYIKPEETRTYWIRMYNDEFDDSLSIMEGSIFEKTSDGKYRFLARNDFYEGDEPANYFRGITCNLEKGKEYYLVIGYDELCRGSREKCKVSIHQKGKLIKNLELTKKESLEKYNYKLNHWSEALYPLKITYEDNTVKNMGYYKDFSGYYNAMTVDPYGNRIYLNMDFDSDYYANPVGDYRFKAYTDSGNYRIESNEVGVPVGRFEDYIPSAIHIPISQEQKINKYQLYMFQASEEGIYFIKNSMINATWDPPINILDSNMNELKNIEGYNDHDDPSYSKNNYYYFEANRTYYLYTFFDGNLKVERIQEEKSEHDWYLRQVLKYPSCSEEGKYLFECKDRPDKYCMVTKEVIVPPNSHHYVIEKIVKGTCSKKGYVSYYCSRYNEATGTYCNARKTMELPMVATNHDKQFERRNAKPATHTDSGYSGDLYCKECNTFIKKGEIINPISEHSWDAGVVSKQATCKDTGIRKYTCTICNASKTSTIPIDEKKHISKIVGKKDCTKDLEGYTGDTVCSVCQKILKKGTVIPKMIIYNEVNGTVNQSKIIKVDKICIKTPSNQIAAGKKVQLSINVLPDQASNKKIKWISSNKKIATVSQSGLVTFAKKTGGKKVVITALTVDGSGKKASVTLKSMKGYVKKVKIKGRKEIKEGKKITLKVNVTATSSANKKLAWSSSNKKYATVNAKGVVTAKKGSKGKSVKITVKSLDGTNKSNTITINIK